MRPLQRSKYPWNDYRTALEVIGWRSGETSTKRMKYHYCQTMSENFILTHPFGHYTKCNNTSPVGTKMTMKLMSRVELPNKSHEKWNFIADCFGGRSASSTRFQRNSFLRRNNHHCLHRLYWRSDENKSRIMH